MFILTWFTATLRQYPEIAIFLTLALGYYFGKFTFKGIGLGSVTATLLAGVLIGQIGISISQPLKATVFLLFLFAVGYAVGPQFVRGVAKDGVPQALFAVVQCAFSLAAAVVVAKIAGYDLGYSAGLYSGSQTISAAMGLSTDAINRLGLAPDEAKKLLDSMPVAYAVTYMFGTVGSAIVIALVCPALLRLDLVKACKDYEQKYGGAKELGGAGTAWHRWEMRAFRVQPGARVIGLRAAEAEALLPQARVFVQRIRRNGVIEEATAETVLQQGDVVAVVGAREALVSIMGERAKMLAASGSREMIASVAEQVSVEVDDAELLSVPVEGVDVYVTNKEVDGKTLVELAQLPSSRGVFLRKITRGAVATSIPILPNTTIFRGDIPTSTVWFMTSVGLNIFIAIVGISAGPGFINGLRTQGISLFLWGVVATTLPLILGMYVGKYIFRFHDAILLGILSGARTTTASLGLVCDRAESQIPALGYTVTYAVGNTLLTIWGMVLIVLLAR